MEPKDNQKFQKLSWTFSEEFYEEPEKFKKDVTEYQRELEKEKECEGWADEVVFDFPEVQIEYNALIRSKSELLENEILIQPNGNAFKETDDYQDVEILAKFKADDGRQFTGLEFLMKTHNQMANKWLGDHVFFEGAKKIKNSVNDLPTYSIWCGS